MGGSQQQSGTSLPSPGFNSSPALRSRVRFHLASKHLLNAFSKYSFFFLQNPTTPPTATSPLAPERKLASQSAGQVLMLACEAWPQSKVLLGDRKPTNGGSCVTRPDRGRCAGGRSDHCPRWDGAKNYFETLNHCLHFAETSATLL